ncbi:MAG: hypothetical protein NVSMB57_11760 [Actinomycetota bacterium]
MKRGLAISGTTHTHEPHTQQSGRSGLREIVLGAQDNLTNSLAIILGVAVGSGALKTVVLAGIAAGLAQSLSMGAVVYTSTKAERDLWFHSEAQERREIAEIPDVERAEVREIYEAQGFTGDVLNEIVRVVTSDEDRWVRVMMTEELGLTPEPPKPAVRAAITTLVAGLVAAAVPVIPFLVISLHPAMIASSALSISVLFMLGAWKGRVTGGRPLREGLELVVIAGLAAGAAVAIGSILKVSTT